jgi:hypothetical protein
MITKLTIDEIKQLLATTPEQRLFDWKLDFVLPKDEAKKAEVVKDIVAIANGTAFTHTTGYIIYGVDPRRPDPIVGVTGTWDDASLQQLLAGVVKPLVEFLYYEVDAGDGRTVAVIEVDRSMKPFHVIARDIGGLRQGLSVIREGSSTRGLTRDDHIRLYLGQGNGYLEAVLQKYGAAARMAEAQNALIAQLAAEERQLHRQMESMVGLPPGSVYPD